MNLAFLLSLAATAMEMASCLICAHNLWRIKRDTFDRSRRMLFLGALMSGLMAMVVVLGNLAMAIHEAPYFVLQPWIGLIYMIMNIIMVLYPICVIREDWLTRTHSFFLFLPTLVLGLLYLSFTNKWTLLHTPADIWVHFWEPDVLARLASLFIMIPYCFILLHLRYNYHSTSATQNWIWNYALGLLIICCVHIALMLTNSPVLLIILPLLVGTFYVLSTEYELEERIRPNKQVVMMPEEAISTEAASAPIEPDLWSRVCRLMDEEEVWRNPDLSLSSLSRLCATNVTYLSRVILQETGSGFKELVNAKRVASVAAQIQQNPDTDVQSAFFNAGYRSRTTAWRNFKDITGQSPADYRQAAKG